MDMFIQSITVYCNSVEKLKFMIKLSVNILGGRNCEAKQCETVVHDVFFADEILTSIVKLRLYQFWFDFFDHGSLITPQETPLWNSNQFYDNCPDSSFL